MVPLLYSKTYDFDIFELNISNLPPATCENVRDKTLKMTQNGQNVVEKYFFHPRDFDHFRVILSVLSRTFLQVAGGKFEDRNF